MSNVDINVDRRTDGLTDGWTDGQKIGRLYRTLLQAGAIKKGCNSPVNDSLFLTSNVYGVNVKCLVDTGSTLSILHPDK